MQKTDASDIRYGSLLDMHGQGFVVLGVGPGIGEHTVRALAQLGARVLCVDIDPSLATKVAEAVDGHAIAADVTKRSDMQKVFEQADRLFGADFFGVVDVVGIAFGRPLTEMADEDWQRQFDLVFTHAHLAIQYGAPLMARNGRGSFVFVSSVAGLGARAGRLLGYGASKAALNHLVRSAAQEWAGRKITVNAVAPGITRTPRLIAANGPDFWEALGKQIPGGRAGEISDVVSAILFFASGLARHVTGNILPVDGGSHDQPPATRAPALTEDLRRPA